MRFMVMVRANNDTEAGVMPTTEEFAAMGKFNEEMVKAGMMPVGEGLHPSKRATRLKFSGAKPTAIDGPFRSANWSAASGCFRRSPRRRCSIG